MNKNLKIGTSVVVIVTAVLVLLVSKNVIDKFLNSYEIILVANTPGLAKGDEVTIRGVRVGTLTEIDVLGSAVHCRIQLPKKYRVPKGSSFEIIDLGIFGEKAVAIQPSDSKDYYSPMDTVESLPVNPEKADGIRAIIDATHNVLTASSIQKKLDSIIVMLNRHDSILNKIEQAKRF